MPDTFQESEYKGYPVCKIYTGEYQGESQFLTLGLKKAQERACVCWRTNQNFMKAEDWRELENLIKEAKEALTK